MTSPEMHLLNNRRMRTAEHVSPGHPDKACDQFADSILDEILNVARSLRPADRSHEDHPSMQRTAIEMLAKDHLVVISGEIRMSPNVMGKVDVSKVVRDQWRRIGYPDAEQITILDHLQVQSSELQVNADREGAGDQGIMVGFATNETASGLPLEYELARNLCIKIQDVKLQGIAPWICADAKSQVTLGPSGAVERVVVAVQHLPEIDGVREHRAIQKRIKAVLMEHVIEPVVGVEVNPDRVTVNGSGSFVVGGTIGDAGVVGRKIVVDAYGPSVPVGGGAYSGKDPTKVDRSAAYMARHIAKTAATMHIRDAKCVTVHIAYGIGLTQPEMIAAETDAGIDISDWVKARFPDLSPRAIADTLDLWNPGEEKGWRYRDTAAFGHYGRSQFPWERLAKVSD